MITKLCRLWSKESPKAFHGLSAEKIFALGLAPLRCLGIGIRAPSAFPLIEMRKMECENRSAAEMNNSFSLRSLLFLFAAVLQGASERLMYFLPCSRVPFSGRALTGAQLNNGFLEMFCTPLLCRNDLHVMTTCRRICAQRTPNAPSNWIKLPFGARGERRNLRNVCAAIAWARKAVFHTALLGN